MAADSTWGKYLGGAYEPGYHIVNVIEVEQCETYEGIEGFPETETMACEYHDEYVPAPDDLDTEIRLDLG